MVPRLQLRQHRFRAPQDRGGDASQPGYVDAVATLRTSGRDPVQENHIVGVFLDLHVVVAQVRQGLGSSVWRPDWLTDSFPSADPNA